jgi:hypothetical protein
MTANPPLADTWDVNFPTAMKDLLREEPALVLTPLLPDAEGRQRFLVHKPDEASGQLELDEQKTNERKSK